MEETKEYIVTCRTKKCENGEIPIQVTADAVDPIIICGVCSKKITDITFVTE